MSTHLLLRVGADLYHTFDFSADVLTPVTLSSVTFTSSDGLTLSNKSDDLVNKRSSIRISGAEHGRTYVVQANGVASSGETIVLDITLQGFNA